MTKGKQKDGKKMVHPVEATGPEPGLPPVPAKDAGYEAWHEFNRVLFEAGKLTAPYPPRK